MAKDEQKDKREDEAAKPPQEDDPAGRKRREIADVLMRVLRGRGLA